MKKLNIKKYYISYRNYSKIYRNYKKILKIVKKNNGYKYNCLKLIEELNELSTVLAQSLTKKSDVKHIHEELGDVQYRFDVLVEYFDKDVVNERKLTKASKSLSYLKTKKYEKI